MVGAQFAPPKRSVLTPTANQALEILTRMRADPVEFVRACRTLDEVDKRAPVKHFPADLEYVRLYCGIWVREPFIAVPKSRRMMMSWLNIILYVWDSAFWGGRNQGFISKKEDDSDKLVQRARFICENLDTAILPKELFPAHEYKYGKLRFPELMSQIQGYASSSDGPRQDTLSGAMCDEMAFWPEAQKLYSALVPTLQGGGRLTAISTRYPGFFKALVFDELDRFSTGGPA